MKQTRQNSTRPQHNELSGTVRRFIQSLTQSRSQNSELWLATAKPQTNHGRDAFRMCCARETQTHWQKIGVPPFSEYIWKIPILRQIRSLPCQLCAGGSL